MQVAETTRGAAGPRARGAARVGRAVVAITGSAGKTTTKDTIAAFLEGTYRVVKNHGQPEQPPGVAAVAARVETRRGCGGDGTGHESRGRNSNRWSTSPSRRSVCGPTSATRTSATSDPSTRLPTPRPRFSKAPAPASLFVGNADDARVMARAEGFPGRVVTFGTSERRRRPRHRRRRPRAGGHAVHGWSRRRGERPLQVPLLGRGNLANVLCATAVAIELGVPLDTIVARAATLTPARRRGEVRRPRQRRDGGRRHLQLQPVGVDARAGDAVRPSSRRGDGWRCSARCSNWAIARSACTRHAAARPRRRISTRW